MKQTPEQEAEYEILRKVLYDEPKDSILKEARLGGLNSKSAPISYEKALRSRERSIRRRGAKEMLLGMIGLLITGGLFAFYWFVIGGYTRTMLIWLSIPFTFGAFNFVRGADRYFLAQWKRGSTACDP